MICLSNITFHLQSIWLPTLVVIYSASRMTLFPSLCMQPSEVSGLFYLNLSRLPFLRQVIDLDLLFCTGFNSEHVVLFLFHILTQKPITIRKIEQNNGRCFGLQQVLANSIEVFISHKKKVTCRCPKYTKH